MLTKISDKIGGARDATSTGESRRAEEHRQAPDSTAGSDTVELTSGAKLLERLDKTLSSLPDIDASRVEAVKTAIAKGDYEIDASKIADALIRSEREFGA
ncbi:flagellar biosynthesis anti-sigma factor FlgM [Woeseia oceani]|uniref:flagellar biosynthesis anti-sigma factor FlgM n=1 Tax=Woeseia oceani TaxID=1548547 RepID=UPI0012EAAE73|nr:flagellar biosynthesis anti-sigma factor FlgM [Woeseia oceani]